MNAVIMSFDPNEKLARESYETYESRVESDSVKLARKATQGKRKLL